MILSRLLALLGSVTLITATNLVTFVSLDQTHRTIYFTPNAGCEELDPVHIGGGETISSPIPRNWVGNWYSVSSGRRNVPGMLGEVAFQGWQDLTFFDVSAIVDPADHDGVREMWPAVSQHPTSGCKAFPCDNAYYRWDDVQTKSTRETEIVCTLGGGTW